MMKADSDKSDAIVDYLFTIWESGGDISKVSDKEAKEAVMEIRKNRQTHVYLNNSDIPKLSDEKLEMAVMDWIRRQTKDWNNIDKELKSLPKPCQAVYSCRTVADEILNGGLNQLFYNVMPPLAEMSIEGYILLGFPKLSRVMEKALDVYRNNKHIFDRYNNGTIEGFSALANENLFNGLDEEFVKEYRITSVAEYIRANAVFFGDETPGGKKG